MLNKPKKPIGDPTNKPKDRIPDNKHDKHIPERVPCGHHPKIWFEKVTKGASK